MNVDNRDRLNKKKGQPGDEGLVGRIKSRKIKLLSNDLTYRSFAQRFGFTRAMTNAAIHETRNSVLAQKIRKAVDSLPLPGESNGAANKE